MKKKIYKIAVGLALRLHNFSYKLASRLAVKAGGGIHPKHRITDYHKFFLDNISAIDTVLDIGCGNGELSFDISQKAGKVTGIDISEKNINKARSKYKSPNLEFIAGDALNDYLPFQNYSVIILSNVLEHIENRVEFLKKIKPLAPKILIRVPLFDRDWITPYKKEMGIEWRSDPTHQTEYTLENFRTEMEGAGLKINSYSTQFGEIWAVVK